MTVQICPAGSSVRRALPVMLCLFMFVAACGDDDTPTDPSPEPSLSGTVTESEPNTSVLIVGATVRLDGVNSGKSTTTNTSGAYAFAGLTEGTFNVRASKPGYEDNAVSVTLSGSRTGVAVPLQPLQQIVNETFSGTVRPLDAACDVAGRPCQRHSIGVHYGGTLDVTLTWASEGGVVDLALELWRGGTRIDASDVSLGSEHVSSRVNAGSTHEVRVIFSNGSVPANYELAVRRPS